MPAKSDPHIEAAEFSITMMLAVANGKISPEDLGRWVVTFNPARAPELPEGLRRPLIQSELSALLQRVVGTAHFLSQGSGIAGNYRFGRDAGGHGLHESQE